ncbi:MAG: ATP-binding protein [Chitinophagaceae bacterium]|nr:ATP-binding protein [Chitinophagaceae bacterium]
MSRIKIKNFGPIKEGFGDEWIEIKKVTLFIGNQGSGKSTAAKLFSTLSWIEKAMVKGQLKQDGLSSYNRFLKHLKYQRIDNYIKNNTEIEYQGRAYSFRFINGTFYAQKAIDNGYILPKIMYVSAERNFLSVVDRPEKLKNLPSTLFTFLDEYDSARNLYSKGIALPIGNVQFEYDALNKIAHISGNDYKLRLSEASSGFQSTVPLFLVTKYLAESLQREDDPSIKTQSVEEQRKLAKEIERIMNDAGLSEEVRQESLRQLSAKYKPACFVNIVEEPEQNLFPSSQQKLLNSLIEYNNKSESNKLIMTTHSPYLINYLTLAVKADMVKSTVEKTDFYNKLNDIVPLHSTIKADELAIYEMDEHEGVIKKLPDYKGLPSDENYLNKGLEESNELFAQLLEIQQAQ